MTNESRAPIKHIDRAPPINCQAFNAPPLRPTDEMLEDALRDLEEASALEKEAGNGRDKARK